MIYDNDEYIEPHKLLEEIVKSLVSVPHEVEIDVTEADSTTIYTIKVVPEDRGMVIGKGGRNFDALETLFHAIASKESRKIVLEVGE